MPRRNMLVIFLAAAIALVCYQRVEHNPYGRYLTHVLGLIDKEALERVPPQDLFDGAMEGIVAQLNRRIDENSAYISATEKARFDVDLGQEFGGVGVRISFGAGPLGEPLPADADEKEKGSEAKDEQPGAEESQGDKKAEPNPPGEEKPVLKNLVVVDPPVPGTPAAKAGIRVHDTIVAIDGKETAPMTMDEVINSMRGPIGSEISLTVRHEGEKETQVYTMERAAISVESVFGEKKAADGTWDFRLADHPEIGYVRIDKFGEKTVEEVTAALAKLTEQGIKALILDLRDDTGGRLDAAVEICQLFLKRGSPIVSIRMRDNAIESQYETGSDGPYVDIPMAVLINGRSASASEIVAACLQDHKRATIVGVRSYGKGTVQHLLKIESGKAWLKLTTAKYWRPNERNIHRRADSKPEDEWGVTPDAGFEVRLDEGQEKRRHKDRARRDLVDPKSAPLTPDDPPADAKQRPDPQLDKAVEELLRQLSAEQPAVRAA